MEPSFRPGDLIWLDPDLSGKPGDDVLLIPADPQDPRRCLRELVAETDFKGTLVMLWLSPELAHGLRDSAFWRVELSRPSEKEAYQVGYTRDPAEALAAIPQIMRIGNGDIVRVIAPLKASAADIQALRALGGVLN